MTSSNDLRSPYAGGKNVAADVASVNALKAEIDALREELHTLQLATSRNMQGIRSAVWDALRDFDPDEEGFLTHEEWNLLDAHLRSYHPKKEETPRGSSFPQAGVPTIFDQATVSQIIDKQRSR